MVSSPAVLLVRHSPREPQVRKTRGNHTNRAERRRHQRAVPLRRLTRKVADRLDEAGRPDCVEDHFEPEAKEQKSSKERVYIDPRLGKDQYGKAEEGKIEREEDQGGARIAARGNGRHGDCRGQCNGGRLHFRSRKIPRTVQSSRCPMRLKTMLKATRSGRSESILRGCKAKPRCNAASPAP